MLLTVVMMVGSVSAWTYECTAAPSTITLYSSGEQIGELVQTDSSAPVIVPTLTSPCDSWVFAGWKEGSEQNATTSTPTLITPGSSYTPTDNVALYAVYSQTVGAGIAWEKVTSLSGITEGTYIVLNGSFYLPNAPATNGTNSRVLQTNISTMGVSVSGTFLIGIIADDMQWNFTGTNTAMTIRSAANNYNYLYTTTANDGVRVNSTTTPDTWAFEVYSTGFAMRYAATNRYCAVSTLALGDWRSYTTRNSASYQTNNGILDLYKKIDTGITTYNSNPSGCCVTPSTVTLHNEGKKIGELTQANCLVPVILPTLNSPCNGWEFAGWVEGGEQGETISAPTLIPSGYYTPKSDVALYAVYNKTESIVPTILFSDDFNNLNSYDNVVSTRTGYSNISNCYTHNGSIRLAQHSNPLNPGSLTIAPLSSIVGTVTLTLTFKAKSWNSEDGLTLSVSGGGTLSQTSNFGLSLESSTLGSPPPNPGAATFGAEDAYTVTITDATALTRITFATSQNRRVILDDIVIYIDNRIITYDSNPDCCSDLTRTINKIICAGETYNFYGTEYGTAQTNLEHRFSYAIGCDSIVTLNLTVNPILTRTENKTICQGETYNFYGTNYNTSQTGITHQFPNGIGCDSIITLNLTVNEILTRSIDKSICIGETYDFYGTEYSTNQTGITHRFPNTIGCDSIITLNLSINTVLARTVNATICQGETYNFYGMQFMADVTEFEHRITNPIGCDSLIILNLTVNEILARTIDKTISQGETYSFYGTDFTANVAGLEHRFSNSVGCDSIVTLNLTVNSILTRIINETICQGETYNFYGTFVTENVTGLEHRFTNANGLDSIVTLNLTVNQPHYLHLTYEKLTKENSEVIAPGQEVTLEVTGVSNVDYVWINKNSNKILGTSTTSEFIIRPYESHWYEVKVDAPCVIGDSVFVPVVWANAITPYDSDGYNDTFLNGTDIKLTVFNRYGQKVFEGIGGWNGKYRDKIVDPGTYYYVAELPDGDVKKGTIAVVKVK